MLKIRTSIIPSDSVENSSKKNQIKSKRNNEYILHFLLSILMVIISLELTRVNPDRNIFSINVELTSTFFTLQRFGSSPSLNFK